MVNKLREDGGFDWWGEYEVLRRKYELGSEYGSVYSWKEKIKIRNEKDWVKEVSSKSTLKQYKLIKNGAGLEKYLRSVQGQGVVRQLFRLRNGSAGLLEDEKQYKIIIDEMCVMCESGAGEMWSICWLYVRNLRKISGYGG